MGSALGDRVRERRKELGYTQERVAELLNTTQSWFHKVEDGAIKRPRGPRLRALADVLGLTFEELSMLAGLADRPSTAALFLASLPTAEAARLEEIHTRLDPLLIELTPTQLTRLEATIRDMIEMMREARAIRQAADPAPPRTSPQSPPAGPAPASPDPAAPESAGSGCGR